MIVLFILVLLFYFANSLANLRAGQAYRIYKNDKNFLNGQNCQNRKSPARQVEPDVYARHGRELMR